MSSSSPTRTAKNWFYRVVPAFDSLREYNGATARADLLAGLTVAAIAVPQAMAYALILGLPPQYGLYTAMVMTIIGALFDSSRQLINGPTNAISIAVLSVIGAIATPETLSISLSQPRLFSPYLVALYFVAAPLRERKRKNVPVLQKWNRQEMRDICK